MHNIHNTHSHYFSYFKPGNVLVALDAQDHVKLCKITDFDVSREISPGEQAVTLCGTPQYSAPGN